MAVNLENQVNAIGQQVAIRSINVDKFKMIRARLDAFCMELAKAQHTNTPLVKQLGIRATISAEGGKRSLKVLFIVMQVISDLQQIKDLGKLRSETMRLQKQAAALEAEIKALISDTEELRENIIAIKALQKKQAPIT